MKIDWSKNTLLIALSADIATLGDSRTIGLGPLKALISVSRLWPPFSAILHLQDLYTLVWPI